MIDIYAKYNQSLGALDQAGKRERFEEKAKSLTSIEAKLNLAESLLGVKESARYIAKKNGAGHNGHEEIRESAERITEVKARQRREASDKALWNAMGISEADQRKLRGDAPGGSDQASGKRVSLRHWHRHAA